MPYPTARSSVGGGAHLVRPSTLTFRVSDQTTMRADGLLDDAFREPILVSDGEGTGSEADWSYDEVEVRGQFEIVKAKQDADDAGRVATVKGRCHVLPRDADAAGIVRADGTLTIKLGDVLVSVTPVHGSGSISVGDGHKVTAVHGSGTAGPRPSVYVIDTEEISVRS